MSDWCEEVLVRSGTSYRAGMQIKIEYYRWPRFLGRTMTVKGYIVSYCTDFRGFLVRLSIEQGGKLIYIMQKNIIRMWHYVLPKPDYDIGI